MHDHPNRSRPGSTPGLQRLLRSGVGALLLCAAVAVPAKEAPAAAEDPALEKRTLAVAAELRCLVCQNQTIADSNAGLAVDLRNQVREMLREGKSEKEILAYMTQRYGDFVLYRPPVNSNTVLLWFGPPALLLVGGISLWLILRRRNQLGAEHFEPDEAEPGASAAVTPSSTPAAARAAQPASNP
jgi:cytochrome c-type biogenesis protein CcmH